MAWKRALTFGSRPREWALGLTVVCTLAFVIRIALNAQFQGMSSGPDPDMGPDAVNYNQLAENLVHGRGYVLGRYPTLHYPPGVPFLLAATYAIGVEDYVAARVVYSALGAAVCGLTVLLAGHFASRPFALMAGLGLALYPDHAFWSMHFLSEVPLGVLYALLALAHIRLLHTSGWLPSLVIGALFGVASLMSPRTLLVIPVYWSLLWLAPRLRSPTIFARIVAIQAVALALTLAPWTVRNYRIAGSFVPVSSHGGSGLLEGNNPLVFSDPEIRGSVYSGAPTDIPGYRELQAMPEAQQNAAGTRLAVGFLRQLSMGELVQLELMKLYRFLTPFVSTPNVTYRRAAAIGWIVAGPLACLGLILAFRNGCAMMMHAILAGYVFMTLVFFGETRYRAPLAPVLFTYVAVGLGTLTRWTTSVGESVHQSKGAEDQSLGPRTPAMRL
jgi:hypothetical protein